MVVGNITALASHRDLFNDHAVRLHQNLHSKEMSKIEWTNETWNMVTGCNKVSPGCRLCYAATMHRRLMGIASQKEKYSRPFLDGAFPYEPALEEPFLVKKPKMFFSPSMSDLLHKNITLEYIAEVFAVMFLNPQHTFQVLTKRAERLPELDSLLFKTLFHKAINRLHDKYIKPLEQEMYQFIEAVSALPLPNVWLGVSVEGQPFDWRIKKLMMCPAAVYFISYEPAIGPLTLPKEFLQLSGRAWVICGGESGHTAKPMHPDWARSIRNQCKAAGVPFFFKQWGEYVPVEDDAQPPFLYFPHNGKIVDGHHVQFVDPEDPIGGTGKHEGFPFMDPFDSILYCEELKAKPCNFWKVGKGNGGNFLDGKQHLEFPQ